MTEREGFEEHLAALERIVEELEAGELSLDDQLQRLAEGVERIKTCGALLDRAEEQVKILKRDAHGALREEPFESEEA